MSSSLPQPSESPSATDPETLGSDHPGETPDHPERNGEEGAGEGDEEEEGEGECGFCLFMKGGGCRDEFVAWEVCIQDAERNEEDVVDKCFDATAALRRCMEAHSDYYEPILRAEKDAEEEVARELEEEMEKKEKELGTNSVAGSDDLAEGIGRSEDSSK
ncbi:hypothetical protein BT93_G1774 [Corymbia citriodora subsp. variegata]|nr:hypothetical protein BT93_G1774 [Corymbia citriodora subsp. variegata]